MSLASTISFDNTLGFYVDNKDSELGIVLIQEWWGIDDNLKEYAHKYSKNGFKVVVPDLYRNRVTQDKDEAKHLMDGMDFKNAVNDIKNMAAYLKSNGAKKIAVIGFCMGGALSICTGITGKGLFDAGICFYGIPPKEYFDYTNLQIPMQFHFGRKDNQKGFSDFETYTKLKNELEAVNFDTSEFYEYDAEHAFMNTHETAYPYNKKEASVAEQRMLQFLEKKLSNK
eukprot:NODE_109_length_19684_cov_0.566709.p7 type:complete len:227 gc:universal NODE_109_length_19684_cov_0.566709:16457-15777(-)